MAEYVYASQADVGEEGVRRFCQWFRHRFPQRRLEAVSLEEDKNGTDLILLTPNGREKRLQVKTDSRAAETGNVFLETVGDEEQGFTGVLYAGNADKLVYIVAGRWEAYVCDLVRVRSVFRSQWLKKPRYPVLNRRNRDGRQWVSIGITVPIPEFASACHAERYNLCEK